MARVDGRGQLRRVGAGDRLRAARIGRAEEPRANPGRSDDRGIGHGHLQVPLPARRRRQVGVVEGVVAELEALVLEARHHVGVLDHALADHEEGGRHAQPPKQGRDPRRPARIRPVVEGQGDAASRPGAGSERAGCPRPARSRRSPGARGPMRPSWPWRCAPWPRSTGLARRAAGAGHRAEARAGTNAPAGARCGGPPGARIRFWRGLGGHDLDPNRPQPGGFSPSAGALPCRADRRRPRFPGRRRSCPAAGWRSSPRWRAA